MTAAAVDGLSQGSRSCDEALDGMKITLMAGVGILAEAWQENCRSPESDRVIVGDNPEQSTINDHPCPS